MRSPKPLEQTIYQIEVRLVGIEPKIWRRLQVPGEFSLAQLHQVLQIAVGWENSHLHRFTIGRRTFEQPAPAEYESECVAEDESQFRLREVLTHEGARAMYLYDFGDQWEHVMVVEMALQAEPGIRYPHCLEGERRCPPEDCGGVPGYLDLLEAIAHPRRRHSRELLVWAGGDFNPEEFSVSRVNRTLRQV